MIKCFDYICDCGHQMEAFVDEPENVRCPICSMLMSQCLSALKTFTEIVPMYPGRITAGNQHKFTR